MNNFSKHLHWWRTSLFSKPRRWPGRLLCLTMTCVISLAIGVGGLYAEEREWLDNTGKHKIVADFVKLDGEFVVLKKKNGKNIRVPLKRLSETDRKLAKELDGEKPADPKPKDPKPDSPKPDNPKPTEPKPDNPKPEDPKPSEPKPDGPKPIEPKPDDPKPAEPKTDNPKPDNPKPVEPKRNDPKPLDPKPAEPGITDPNPGSGTSEEPGNVPPESNEPDSAANSDNSSDDNGAKLMPDANPGDADSSKTDVTESSDAPANAETSTTEPVDPKTLPMRKVEPKSQEELAKLPEVRQIDENQIAAMEPPFKELAETMNRGNDKIAVRKAVKKIFEMPQSGANDSVIGLLQKHATFEDKFIRMESVRALAKFAPDLSLPYVLKFVGDENFEIRSLAYDLLVELRNPNSIEPLIKKFSTGDHAKISFVLESFGTISEMPIHKLLKSSNKRALLGAIRLLGRIGTESSLEPLTEIKHNSSGIVRMSATSAIKKIKERESLNF